MALVNTADEQKTFEIKDTNQLVRILQGAIADESSANALYNKVIDSLKESKIENDLVSKVIEQLQEIALDEANHFGVLLGMVTDLNEEIGKGIKDGIDGEED